MKTFFTVLCNLIMIANVYSANTLPESAIDLTDGSLFIKDGSYAVGTTDNTPTTTHTGAYDIYSSTSIANNITIEAAAQEINLWDININTTGFPMTVSSRTNITLNFIGENILTTSSSTATSIYLIKKATETTLTLNGEKLSTSSMVKGIGGSSVNNINIINNLKYLNISTPLSTKVAIGGGNMSAKLKSVVVGNDCVLTITGGIATNQLVIGKASLKIEGSITVTPVNSNGDLLHCITVPRNGTQTVSVKNNETNSTEDYTFTYTHPDDDNYYLYLPNGDYTLTTGGITYSAVVNGAAVTATIPAVTGDGIIDVSLGSVSINEGNYQIGNQPYTYSGGLFTISGASTTNSVIINGGANEVTLDGLDIQSTSGCTMNINTGADLTLILKEGTINTLSSAGTYAGLQKSQTDGMLTIKGKGTLIASSSGSAGIGAANSSPCSNITIEEGTIVATTTAIQSAAIGGHGACSNISIKGGDITATSYSLAYAIGSYFNNSIANFNISGGIVRLYSGDNNYGNYLLPPNSTITGGTITGKITQGTTGALMGSGSVITGGTVTFEDVNGNFTLSDASHPTNGVTTDKLYRSQFVVPGISEETLVTSISVDGKDWGCNDVYTTADGLLYLWLPADDASQYETTTIVVNVNGLIYTYVGQIDPLDNLVTASGDVTAKGNYFYQLPLSISATHAMVTVTDPLNQVWKDGDYISSGLLDDNKPRLKISASPESDYYSIPVLSVSPAELGTTYYKVTAVMGETVNIMATSLLQTFSVTFEAPANGSLQVLDNGNNPVASGDKIDYGSALTIIATANEGYKLLSLKVNEKDVENSASINVTGATTITAFFVETATAIDDNTSSSPIIYASDKKMCVKANAGDMVTVYNQTGTIVINHIILTNDFQSFQMTATGLYLIQINEQIFKCLIP